MNTATKVGEIFTKAAAGDSYNKIGDMIIMLAPAAHELIAIDEKNAIYYDVSLQNIDPGVTWSGFFSLINFVFSNMINIIFYLIFSNNNNKQFN